MRELLDSFLVELESGTWSSRTAAADVPAGRVILDATPADQAALLPLIAEGCEPLVKNRTRYWIQPIVAGLAGQMLRRKLPLTESDLLRIADRVGTPHCAIPKAPAVGAIEAHVAEHGLSDAMRAALTELRNRLDRWAHRTEDRRLLMRLQLLLGGITNRSLFAASDAWIVAAVADLDAMEPEQQAAWHELLTMVRSAPAKPSKKWLKDTSARIDRIGADAFRDALRRWLPLFDQPKDRYLPDAFNVDVLRGLIFSAIVVADSSFPPLLGDAAERAYRKIPGIGAVSGKIGTACVVALSAIGSPEATAQLERLKSRVELLSALKVIDRALEAAAKRAGS